MFNTISDKFFAPLASPNKLVYWECICKLFSCMNHQLSFGVERDNLIEELQYYFEQMQSVEWNEEELQKAQDDWGLVPEEWGVELPDFGLPDELAGEDLTPDELEDIIGDDKTEMQRVIITYYPDQEPLLKSILGLESIDKVLYQVSELVK